MPYYTDPQGGLHFLTVDDVAAGNISLLPAGCVATTDEAAGIVQTPPPTVEQLWANYQSQAQAALDKSDTTMLRCAENSVPVPAEWAAYRKALRAIIGAKVAGDPTQALPTIPAYPAGT